MHAALILLLNVLCTRKAHRMHKIIKFFNYFFQNFYTKMNEENNNNYIIIIIMVQLLIKILYKN